MSTGRLKMWSADRGFGFVMDDSGGPDIYVHASALEAAGIDPDSIKKGDRLTYDVEVAQDGRTRASNIRQG
jgi:CspA family cold shock protein